MSDYFISDLHLKPSRNDIAEGFFHFVETTASDAQRLYILGDFFDAWIGDDEDDTFYTQILQKLSSYSQQGLALFFLHGNRDFLVGEGFATATGATLLNEEHLIELNGEAVLLMHGDSLCIDDDEYLKFRAQVRNPAWQQQILQLPLQQRRAMAAQLRTQSQSMNAMKAEDIMDVNGDEVKKVMLKHNARTIIHGHTHRPAVHKLDNKGHQRIVLGDWESQGWFVRADGSDIQLHSFDL